jgi:hypothetical protein
MITTDADRIYQSTKMLCHHCGDRSNGIIQYEDKAFCCDS